MQNKKQKSKLQNQRPATAIVNGMMVTIPPKLDLSTISKMLTVPKEDDHWLKAVANIATNAWRIKTKIVDPDTGEAKEEMKRIYRHVEGILETLEELGVETIDPINEPYDSGMALKVISFEKTQGLTKEEIKETIKPSIIWQKNIFLQIGEVIVGTP